MDHTERQHLEREVGTGGAYVRNLAAAEAAVQRGQFNVAKVLRAMAHAQWIRAMEAARLLAADLDPAQLFRAIPEELPGDDGRADDPAVRALHRRHGAVRAGVADIAGRAAASLAANSDVLESDVAQFVWACFGCGNLTEGAQPERCAICGATPPEFRLFMPFYSATPEHLGQRTPAEIAAILAAVPDALAAIIAGVDEATLARKPSPDEWSAAEIMAHILETDLLFAERARLILDQAPGRVPAIDSAVPPWLLHEGKGYPEMPAAAILERLRRVREESLALIGGARPEQSGWYGSNGGERATLLDLGTWLANHDQGHTAQIRRLCAVPAR